MSSTTDSEAEQAAKAFLARLGDGDASASSLAALLSITTLFRLSQLAVGVNSALHAKLVAERALAVDETQRSRAALDADIHEFTEFDSKLRTMQRDKPIKLNVGGTYFAVSPRTLCLREPKSFFSVLFSGRWEIKLGEEDGALFIDRSPLVFPLVLDYLRGNDVDVSELTKTQLRLLQSDADFYQLDGLLSFFRQNPQTVQFTDPKGINSLVLRKDKTVATSITNAISYAVSSKPLAPPFHVQRIEIFNTGCVAVGLAPPSSLPLATSALSKRMPFFLKIGTYPRPFDHSFYQWDNDGIGPGSFITFQLNALNNTVSVFCDNVQCCRDEFAASLPSLLPGTSPEAYHLVVIMQANGCSVKIA